MHVSVAQQQVSTGESFDMQWAIDTQGTSINVVEGTIYFTLETLTLSDIVLGDSAFTLWVEAPHLVEPGVIKFVGGIPSGITGSQVALMRTLFDAKSAGTATVTLSTDTVAMRADGVATPVRVGMNPVTFSILEDSTHVVRSPSHPREDRWSQESTVVFEITETNPVTYSFSTNPEIIPSGEPIVVQEKITYKDVPDGIYYFKVATQLNGVLHELDTYRILIDSTDPTLDTVMIDTTSELYDRSASLSFYPLDKTSGIDQVRVRTGWFGLYRPAQSPYRLHKPLFGNVVRIQVTDKAGNTYVSKEQYRGYLPNWVSVCVTLVLSVCIVYLITKHCMRILHFCARLRSSRL